MGKIVEKKPPAGKSPAPGAGVKKPVAKRHARKNNAGTRQLNLEKAISTSGVARLAHQAGAKRLSKDLPPDTQERTLDFLTRVLTYADAYRGKCKTFKVRHILQALDKEGIKMYCGETDN